MVDSDLVWFVVYTLPRWEKKIANLLLEKGYESYCPTNKVHRKWSDRMKVVNEPLFKGYVFVRLQKDNPREILKIHGIVNFVHWLGKPAIVREDEIETIKKFLGEFENVEVGDFSIAENDYVIVNQGILMNYKGIVLERSGNRVKVNIENMGISLLATFNANQLEKINLKN